MRSYLGNFLFKAQCKFTWKSNRLFHTAILECQTNQELLRSQNGEKIEPQGGICQKTFRDRRLNLMSLIGDKFINNNKIKNHLLLIPSNPKSFMSENIPYPFRQNTDFLYLTGVKEPETILLLQSVENKCLPEHTSILFIPKTSEHAERWEGKKFNFETAATDIGVDEVHFMDELENYLHCYISKHSHLLFWYNSLRSTYPRLQDTIRNLVSDCNITSFDSPHPLIQQLRLIKSAEEIKLMEQTCKIASESMSEVMKFSHPSILESHLHAKMEFECRLRGAENLAFPPVVAGGDRANTIHYISNNQIIRNGETVLMDAGCEFHGYASDITRTWPVSGKFTSPQRDLYEVILSVQNELIELCGTFPSLDHLFDIMCRSMGKKFQEIGLIPSTVSSDQATKAAYDFCPHHVSHYLGMDVHDTAFITRSTNIKPGMVITVEPGVYIRSDNQKVRKEYRGLCVRIEDDVLITDNGPLLLTSSCPRNIEDIEKLISTNEE